MTLDANQFKFTITNMCLIMHLYVEVNFKMEVGEQSLCISTKFEKIQQL